MTLDHACLKSCQSTWKTAILLRCVKFGSRTWCSIQDPPITNSRTWGNLGLIYELKTVKMSCLSIMDPSLGRSLPTPIHFLYPSTTEAGNLLGLLIGTVRWLLLAKEMQMKTGVGLQRELSHPCGGTGLQKRAHCCGLLFFFLCHLAFMIK